MFEIARAEGLEHAEFGLAQRLFGHAFGFFKQRVVIEIMPHGHAGAVANQQSAARGAGA